MTHTAKERRRRMRARAWARQVDRHRKNVGWLKRHDAWWEWRRLTVTKDGYTASAYVKTRPGPHQPVLILDDTSVRIEASNGIGTFHVSNVLLEQHVPSVYHPTHARQGTFDLSNAAPGFVRTNLLLRSHGFEKK